MSWRSSLNSLPAEVKPISGGDETLKDGAGLFIDFNSRGSLRRRISNDGLDFPKQQKLGDGRLSSQRVAGFEITSAEVGGHKMQRDKGKWRVEGDQAAE